ncbi:MAG: hypothetical protein LBV69_00360 [Bacteroidales bacterium]|jgi:hypothetical protein|nr:hypothetical protein [Bacteroidales bacterium]
MIEKPNIAGKQVAIIRVDYLTGHVLDDEFNLYNAKSENRNVYSIFESLDIAKAYIDKFRFTHKTIEFCIYDSSYNVLEYIKAVILERDDKLSTVPTKNIKIKDII